MNMGGLLQYLALGFPIFVQLVLTGSVAAMTTTTTPNATTIGCFVEGECYKSDYIAIAVTENSRACLEYCQSVEGCTQFTYYSDHGACFAFSECVELRTEDCSDCASGDAVCPAYQCSLQGKCDGSFVGFDYFQSEEECIDLCRLSPDCGWWSYASGNGYCVLTEDCPTVDVSINGTTYGEQGCPEHHQFMCDSIGLADGLLLEFDAKRDRYECANWCHDNAACQYWSINTETKLCILSENLHYLDTSQTEFITSERDCPLYNGGGEQQFCNIVGQFQAGLVAFDVTASQSECVHLCQDEPACDVWSF